MTGTPPPSHEWDLASRSDSHGNILEYFGHCACGWTSSRRAPESRDLAMIESVEHVRAAQRRRSLREELEAEQQQLLSDASHYRNQDNHELARKAQRHANAIGRRIQRPT